MLWKLPVSYFPLLVRLTHTDSAGQHYEIITQTGSDSCLVSHQILVQSPWHCVALFHLCAWQGCGQLHFAPVAPWPGRPKIAYESTCNLLTAAWPQVREAETEPTEGRKRQCEAAVGFWLKTKLKHWKRTLCLYCSLLKFTSIYFVFILSQYFMVFFTSSDCFKYSALIWKVLMDSWR